MDIATDFLEQNNLNDYSNYKEYDYWNEIDITEKTVKTLEDLKQDLENRNGKSIRCCPLYDECMSKKGE